MAHARTDAAHGAHASRQPLLSAALCRAWPRAHFRHGAVAARLCGAGRPLVLPAGHQQGLSDRQGRVALRTRDRDVRHARAHSRPAWRRAGDVDAGQVGLGDSRRCQAGARPRAHPGGPAGYGCARTEPQAGRRTRLRLSQAPDCAGCRRARRRPQTAGHSLPERIPPLLSDRRSHRAHARLHRRRRCRPGRHRAGAQRAADGQSRQPRASSRTGAARSSRTSNRSMRRRKARTRCSRSTPSCSSSPSRNSSRRSPEHKAKAGGIVVIDAKNGEVLALANLPTYNPNNRTRLSGAQLRNRAFTDTFEPGSTFKPFTVALALEKGNVRVDTQIQTAPGKLTIGSATISDAHAHGVLSVAQVIQKSSNIGTAKMALNLPSAGDVEELRQARFRAAAETGFPRRSRRSPAALEALAADRAGHHVLWPWHFCDADPAGARLPGLRAGR